jgi:hypothetical protein
MHFLAGGNGIGLGDRLLAIRQGKCQTAKATWNPKVGRSDNDRPPAWKWWLAAHLGQKSPLLVNWSDHFYRIAQTPCQWHFYQVFLANFGHKIYYE